MHCRNCMRNICDVSSEVAALLFQAHANYGTWSIDFELNIIIYIFMGRSLKLAVYKFITQL